MRWRRELITALALVLLTGSGCAKVADVVVLDKPAPRVSVKGYPLDIAYGAEPIPPPEVSDETPLTEIVREAFGELFTEDAPGRSRPPGPAPEFCPEPGPSAVAIEPITTDVKRAPDPGVYLFKQSGTKEFTIPGIGAVKVPISGYTSRVIRNVRTAGAGWAFDVEQTIGETRAVVSFATVPAETAASPEAAGVRISKLVFKRKDGDVAFTPATTVSVLPLPSIENKDVVGAGVDPVTGRSMVATGTILRKERVAGCDEVADGWFVSGKEGQSATWTFNGPQFSLTITAEYAVATQHGGTFLLDRFRFTDPFAEFTPAFDITSSFGSITPRPE